LALILEMLTKKEEFIRVQVDNHAGQWHSELATW
jgi:hypothetical protein